jgi:hypothetical protein
MQLAVSYCNRSCILRSENMEVLYQVGFSNTNLTLAFTFHCALIT